MNRSLREVFRFRARSALGLGDRLHAYADCHQITGNGCVAVEDPSGPERPLCWSCVRRFGRG